MGRRAPEAPTMRPRSAAQRRQDFGAQRRARRTHFALRGVAQKLPPALGAASFSWCAKGRKMMAARCSHPPGQRVGWVVVATPVRPGSCPGKRDVTQDNKYNRVSSLPAVGSARRLLPANARPGIARFCFVFTHASYFTYELQCPKIGRERPGDQYSAKGQGGRA